MTPEQEAEVNKYKHAYRATGYGMGQARRNAAVRHLKELQIRGSLLDVGCGRGEMVDEALRLGFRAEGIDPATCELYPHITFGLATDLPHADKSIDVITCFDVMEHLLREDHKEALKEMRRVARFHIVIAAADFPHKESRNGPDYHISYMPQGEWDKLFRSVFSSVRLLPRYGSITPTWLVSL